MIGEYLNSLCIQPRVWHSPYYWSLESELQRASFLHCVALRVAFIVAATSACYAIVADALDSCSHNIICVGMYFLRRVLRRRIAYNLSSRRNCSVLLSWCRDLGAEPRAQNPPNLRVASGADSRIQYDATRRLISHFIMQHLVLHEIAESYISMRLWSVGVWSGCWGGKTTERVMLLGIYVYAKSCNLPATIRGRHCWSCFIPWLYKGVSHMGTGVEQ